MRILYLSNAVIPSEASRSLSIMKLCQAFTNDKHTIELFAIDGRSKLSPSHYYGLSGGFLVKLIALPRFLLNKYARISLLQGLVLGLKYKARVKEGSYDLIYSRLTLSELIFVPKTIPICYEMHSLGHLGGYFHQKILFKWLLKNKNFVKIIVTTDYLQQALSDFYPVEKITVARLSAEEPVKINVSEIEKFKHASLRNPDKKFHVGYTGYLDTYGQRGTDIICKIASKIPHAEFHIVGGDKESVTFWKEYSKQYNVHGNIHFYGYRKSSEMPFFLECFDVVLAPLQHRPSKRAPIGQNMSPLKLGQYMAYKKAIVASDLVSHREVLTDDLSKLLVAHDDVDSWCEMICSLLSDTEQKRDYQNRAYERYLSEFTPSQRVTKILEGL